MKKLKLFLILYSIFLIFQIINALPSSWSDETDTTFDTGSSPSCNIGENSATWTENEVTTNALTSCYRVNGINPTNGNSQTSCCPAGYSCDGQTPNSICKQSTSQTITKCADYKGESECNLAIGDSLNQATKKSIEKSAWITIFGGQGEQIAFCDNGYSDETNGKCISLGGCACSWNSNANNGAGVCAESYDYSTSCDPTQNRVTCRTTQKPIENKCNSVENVIRLSWDSVRIDVDTGDTLPGNDNNCKSGSRDFPCPVTSSLPFFGFFNLIASLLLIFGFYFFMFRRM